MFKTLQYLSKDFINILNTTDGHPAPYPEIYQRQTTRPPQIPIRQTAPQKPPPPWPQPPRRNPAYGPPPQKYDRIYDGNQPFPWPELPGNNPWICKVQWYHGTSLENARKIRDTDKIKFGNSTPPGFYISPSFDFARKYATQNGAICMILLLFPINVIRKNEHDYYIPSEGKQLNAAIYSSKKILISSDIYDYYGNPTE